MASRIAKRKVVFGPGLDDAGTGRINMIINLVLLPLGIFTDLWTDVAANDRDIKEEADFGVGGLGFFSQIFTSRGPRLWEVFSSFDRLETTIFPILLGFEVSIGDGNPRSSKSVLMAMAYPWTVIERRTTLPVMLPFSWSDFKYKATR